MRRWREVNRPRPPADPDAAVAETAEIEALWRWLRARMRAGLGCRHRPAPEPDLSPVLLDRWRWVVDDLVDVARLDGSLHPLDVDAAARYVRERLRYELGHRRRWARPAPTVTDLQFEQPFAAVLKTALELGRRHRVREGGGALLAVTLDEKGLW